MTKRGLIELLTSPAMKDVSDDTEIVISISCETHKRGYLKLGGGMFLTSDKFLFFPDHKLYTLNEKTSNEQVAEFMFNM